MKSNFTPTLRRFVPGALVLIALLLPAVSPAQSDAGVSGILTPPSPMCPGSQPFSAIVHNFGPDTLTSVTVIWAVNSLNQSPLSLTDTILPGEEDTVLLGSAALFPATSNQVTAYTSAPNGTSDADPSNDTSSVSGLMVRMDGQFTVGGTTPDFARFADAVTALNTYGVCGPVTLDLRPQTDTVKVALNAIAGASAVNTILIRSENGDSTSVILTQPSAGNGFNDYLIRLNGADYVTFSRLTLQRTGTGNLQHVIDFTNTATFNTVEYCRIRGGAPFGTSTQGALIFSSSQGASNDSMNTVRNNLIEGGTYGVYMNGASQLSLESGNSFTDNLIVNQNMRGIHLNFQRSPVVSGNRILSSTTNAGYASVYLLRVQGAIVVTKNQLSTLRGFGIYLNTCISDALTPGLTTNNFTTAGDSAAIRILSCAYQNVLNNSAFMRSTGLTTLYISGNGSGNILENNILMHDGGGYSIFSNSFATSGILFSDYNNFYTTGPFVGSYGGADKATVADWTASTGTDNNSISLDPQYVSPLDLHATSAAMDNLGQSLGYVPDDIDGDLRSVTTPDIGADEYSAGTHDLSVTALLEPADSLCGSPATRLIVVLENAGTVPAGGVMVHADISGDLSGALSQLYPFTLQPGATDTVRFIATLNTTAGGNVTLLCYADYGYDDNRANDTLVATRFFRALPSDPDVTDGSLCGPGAVTLSALSADSLTWFDMPTGGTVLATGGFFNTPLLSTTTTYYVSAYDGCESNRVPVVAYIYALPVVDLGSDTVAGGPVVLDAGPGFASYSWSTTEVTQTISAAASGTYFVLVTDSNGCTATDTILVTILTGIRPLSSAATLAVYPNPATGYLTVEWPSLEGATSLRMTDLAGKRLKEMQLETTSGFRRVTVPLEGIAPGAYVLEVSAASGSIRQPVVVR